MRPLTLPGGLTVLRTTDLRWATKCWIWSTELSEWRKISYEAGSLFTAEEHVLGNLRELGTLLEQGMRDPAAFVVRGALTPEAAEAVAKDPNHRIRRRKHLKDGIQPTLVEVARSWLMIDIDGWPLRPIDDLATDPELPIDAAVHELLPQGFHDAECWWQLSASAGFVPGMLKVHLFFWLTEPHTNEHIKRVLEQHAPDVDRAPFSAAQPHFIAAPIIEGGHDPIPRRCGWRKGILPAVNLPDLRPEPARPRSASSSGSRGRDIQAMLARLGDGPGLGGFHDVIRAATLAYARRCSRTGQRDDEGVKALLRTAIRAAPVRVGPDRAGDLERYTSNYYLQDLIDGAFALLRGDPEIRSMRPHYPAASATIEDARAALAEHIDGFFSRTAVWNALPEDERPLPEHAGLMVGVGTGKSTAARAALPRYIEKAKAERRPHRIVWAVPTHRLGGEALAEMRRLGLNAAIWHGREASVPGSCDPDDAVQSMRACRNLDAVHDALAIHAKVEQAVCGSGKPGEPFCPWRTGRDQCLFQAQKPAIANADVIIIAHQVMFTSLPKEVRRGLAAVIVDESWWQAGLLPHRELNLDGFADEPLRHPVLARSPKGLLVSDDPETNDLHALSAMAEKGFRSITEGELVSKEAMIGVGLTAAHCASAIALEWRRLREGVIQPGQTQQQRKEAMQSAKGNGVIPKRASLWRALKDLLEGDASHTGRIQIGRRDTADGSLATILLHSRLDIREEIFKLPMLLLDATMPTEIVRHYLPRLEVLAEVRSAAPHMTVHQIIGGWGKTSLVPHDRATAEENRRRGELVNELADFVALNSAGDALVLTYQAIEERFARPGIRTAHFNAIAGLDEFKGVRSLFVIGRPLPDSRELREAALALTGLPIPDEVGHDETRGALMIDGSGAALNVRAFKDPTLEAMRAAITEAEITQAVGRGRGVTRTSDNPLRVWLFTDVATAFPVTSLVRWAETRPSIVERMAGRGLVLTSAADGARIYPDLFVSAAAARQALHRIRVDFCDIPLGIESLLGECHRNRLVEVTYRPEGRGQQTRRAWIAVDRVEGLAEWLSSRLGGPVHVVRPIPPPSPASAYSSSLSPAFRTTMQCIRDPNEGERFTALFR